MADKNINIKVNTTADTKGISSILNSMNSIRGGINALAGMAIFQYLQRGIEMVWNFGRSAVQAFAQAEVGERRLSTSLRLSGANVESYMTKFRTLSKELQNKTSIEDDAIIKEIAHANTLGIAADKLEEYAVAAVGLAGKLDVDLGAAMDMIIKASNGSFMAFQRAAGGMKLTGTDAEKLVSVLKFSSSGLKDWEGRMQTLSEQQKRLGNTWQETKEQLGQYISELLQLPNVLNAVNNALRKENESERRSPLQYIKEGILGRPLETSLLTNLGAGLRNNPVGIPSPISPDKEAELKRKTMQELDVQMQVYKQQQKSLENIDKNTGALKQLTQPQ